MNFRNQHYLSRSAVKIWSLDNPIGDAYGGPAYGEKADVGSALSIGSSLVGGIMGGDSQSDAASKASGAQVQATKLGIDEQRRQFDALRELLLPYTQAATGYSTFTPIAENQLIDMSSGAPKANASLYASDPKYKAAWDKFYTDYTANQNKYNTSPLNGTSGPITNFGDIFGSPSSVAGKPTFDLQSALANLQANGFDLNAYNAQQTAANKTKGSLDVQKDLLGLNGADAQQAALASLQNSPVFSGLVQQGENAILQNASATGGLRGGNTQGALAQFRPNMLNQLIQQQFANLGGLTSLGQNAAAGVGNAGMSSANQISNLLQQQGAAQAGNYLAQGQANSNMWGGLGSALGQIGGLASGAGGFGNLFSGLF